MYPIAAELSASVLRSVLIAWIIACLGLSALEPIKPNLTMIFYLPANTSEAIANRTAPAIAVAFETLKRLEILSGFDVTWRIADCRCSSVLTAKIFDDSWIKRDDKTHVMFGGYCEKVCHILNTLSDSLDLPFLAIGCRTSRARNRILFPNHVSVEPSRRFTIAGLLALLENFNWKRLVILTVPTEPMLQLTGAVKTDVEARQWTAILMVTTITMVPEGFSSPQADQEVELILAEIKKEGRSEIT